MSIKSGAHMKILRRAFWRTDIRPVWNRSNSRSRGRRPREPWFFDGKGRSLIEAGIHIIYILLVQAVLHQPQCFAEALEMDDFPGAKEPDGVGDIRIVAHAQDIVVGKAGLLLCCDRVRTTFPFGPRFGEAKPIGTRMCAGLRCG